jgi:CRP/FNR family transcriptional regulator
MNGEHVPDWTRAFPEFGAAADPEMQRLARDAHVMTLAEGPAPFGPHGFWLLVEGTLRVRRLAEGGSEIMLCRILRGRPLWLSALWVLVPDDVDESTSVVVESRARVAAIPAPRFLAAFHECRAFRSYVCAALTSGIGELVALVRRMRFENLTQRVARWLLDKADDRASIGATHADVALELGTAREVVSRLLKDFERAGWVKLCRGRIDLIDRAGLRRLADQGNAAVRRDCRG